MDKMTVTVVYAQSASSQFLREITVPQGSTVQQVIEASTVCTEFPEIDLTINKVGILSQVVTLSTIVQPGDRVEIYRPLIFDPMKARRLRAKGLNLSQCETSAAAHQKTPLNDAVRPVHPVPAIDTNNPNDPD